MFAFFGKNKHSPFLRAGTGELLELKEGVVVDEKGRPIGPAWERHAQFAQRARAVLSRGGLPLLMVGAFAIPMALFAGLAVLTLIGGFTAIFVLALFFNSVFGIGISPNRPGGRRAR